MKIPLTRPYITQKLKEEVCAVLESGYLTEGDVTREFEACVQTYLGVKHTLAVCNCTVGLEMALRAMGIGTNHEVIVPDYTYPATAAAVNMAGAKIRLVDIDRKTLLIDYDALEAAITPKTKVVIPVSIFGNPLDYDRLSRIKEDHGVYMLEDAACALGAGFKGWPAGAWADITVFSLHPRKFITTGEGGLITTNNDSWAKWLKSYKHFGQNISSDGNVEFNMIGGNYKLSNINAAVGLWQIRQIEKLLRKRRSLAARYLKFFKEQKNIEIPMCTKNGDHSFQSFCILVDRRDWIKEILRSKGIETQIGTYALHCQRAFQNKKECTHHGFLTNSIYAFEHSLSLPLYHEMTEEEQDRVVDTILEIT